MIKRMEELCQLYSEQALPLKDKGGTKTDIFSKGLLHGASHVWIWRDNENGPEILVQKRASTKKTWSNKYDISAAGHIDLGEEPLDAALRETKEEINLDIELSMLKLISVHRAHLTAENGSIENEFQWLYTLKLSNDASFELQTEEVASLKWLSLDEFKAAYSTQEFVPHSEVYYQSVIRAIEFELA